MEMWLVVGELIADFDSDSRDLVWSAYRSMARPDLNPRSWLFRA